MQRQEWYDLEFYSETDHKWKFEARFYIDHDRRVNANAIARMNHTINNLKMRSRLVYGNTDQNK